MPVQVAEPRLGQWLRARVPEAWFDGPPEISADGDEILVVGRLAEPSLPAGAPRAARDAACRRQIAEFRALTRAARSRLGAAVERQHGRRLSWGAECGEVRELFTGLGIPVMTRLRLPERVVLDTLVEAGVARSRSDALAWCVRLVGLNEDRWIGELRAALEGVRRARSSGPRARGS